MSYINVGKLTEEVNNLESDIAKLDSRPYYTFKWPFDSATLASGASTKHEFTITPKLGRPIFLNINGDFQTVTGSSNGWIDVRIFVDSTSGTELARELGVSENASSNVPFSLTYLDTDVQANIPKHYYFQIKNGGSVSVSIAENSATETPQLIAFEI